MRDARAGAWPEVAGARPAERENARRDKPAERRRLVRIKVLAMGAAGVGKSCLMKRYCENKFFPQCPETIGVDYGVKRLDVGKWDVRVNLWDLAGGPEYLEVRNEFYRDGQGVLLVFDATSRASFDALPEWLREWRRYAGRTAADSIVFVVATKVDRVDRAVSSREGNTWASANGFPYFEASAASGECVAEVFDALFVKVLETAPGVPDECARDARLHLVLGGGGGGGGAAGAARKPRVASQRRPL